MPGISLRTFVSQFVESMRIDLSEGIFSFWVNTLGGSVLVPRALRILMYRAAGIKMARAQVYPGCFISGRKMRIGTETAINRHCRFDVGPGITLGERVRIGQEVLFVTSSHDIGPSELRSGPNRHRPIVVEDGCWIGARVTVLADLTIRAGCVIAAGSVVNKDTQPNGLYAGVPARRIRDLD